MTLIVLTYTLAKRLFEISGSAWVDVLATFANAGLLDAEAFGESIAEDKYVRRCDAQSVRRFVRANSLENLEKSGNALAAQIWLNLVISEGKGPFIVIFTKKSQFPFLEYRPPISRDSSRRFRDNFGD